eukprot:g5209.t1
MKFACSVAALCLVLACASLAQGTRLERSLKQGNSANANAYCVAVNGVCRAEARVTLQTINDAVDSIGTALSTAIANAEGGADVDASSFAFAQAIARAYARIISSHHGRVYTTAGGTACAFTRATGEATASAFSRAITQAFAQSRNQYASAAAGCFANAVSSASYTATQNAFTGVCTNYGYDFIYRRFVTTGYVQTIATAFSSVFTAIRDNNAQAAASCGASGTSQSGQTTIVTGSG